MTLRSTDAGDTDMKTEMSERPWQVGGGTAEVPGDECQAFAARSAKSGVPLVNRRVRNRTHGGVGAEGGQPPSAT